MLEHFEGVIENLGDILFGDDSNEEDLRRFVMAQPDVEQDAFAKAMAENLLIQEIYEMLRPKIYPKTFFLVFPTKCRQSSLHKESKPKNLK